MTEPSDSILGSEANHGGFLLRISLCALKMAGPTFIMFVTMAALNLLCIGLIGSHGSDIDLAAMGLSNVFCNVTGFSMLWGLASALDTLSPQAFGANAHSMIGVYLQRCILVVAVLGVLPILIIWIFASPILLALGQDADVVKGVQLFAVYRIPGLFCLTVYLPISKTLTALGKTAAVGASSMTAAILCSGFAYLLIAYLNMGVRGAALVQSTREVLQMTIIIGAALCDADFQRSWTPWSRKALEGWIPFLKLSVPAMVMQNVEWWSWEIVTFESGLLSADLLATQTVLANVTNVTYFAPLAISYSTSMLVGKFLGARDIKAARKCAMILVVDTVAILAVAVMVLIVARRPIAEALSGGVSETVIVMVPMCAIFSFLDGLQTAFTGVVKGTGQQKIFAPIILTCYWAVGLPLGYLLGFHFDFKLYGLWYGMMAGAGLHSLSYAAVLGACVSFDRAADEAAARLQEKPPDNPLVDVATNFSEVEKPLLD